MFINELLGRKIVPCFLKIFYFYLIVFFLALISGSSIFLYYVYPSLSYCHEKTMHLDIAQDLKRTFLNLIQCNDFATIQYEKPALLQNQILGISIMSYVNEQQIYFQNALYDMNIYIESEMENTRDIPFQILSMDNNVLNTTF